MEEPRTTATWTRGLEFQVDFGGGESITLTSLPAENRPGPGPSPMESLQASVAGCTGIDVVMILEKMRQNLESLRIEVHPTRREEHPRIYTDIELVYHADGESLQPEQVLRAVELSQDKYCSVSAMLKPTVNLTYRVVLNGKDISG